jgi:hypothetical protein
MPLYIVQEHQYVEIQAVFTILFNVIKIAQFFLEVSMHKAYNINQS